MAAHPRPPAAGDLLGLSLCSGVGGLEIGLHVAEPRYRTVCHVEREAFAAACLVARMADQALDHAPVWDDLATFDGRRWRGCVDIVTAGYPCQPFSTAGKRLGARDPRHLWPHVRRIVVQCRPRLVFLENVGGHLSLGFDVVHRELSRLGFEVAARLQSAAETGASHERERLFILAVARHVERPPWRAVDDAGVRGAAAGERPAIVVGGSRAALADDGEGPETFRTRQGACTAGEGHQRERRRDAADGGGEGLADAGGIGGEAGRSRQTGRQDGAIPDLHGSRLADADLARSPGAEQPGQPGQPGQAQRRFGAGSTAAELRRACASGDVGHAVDDGRAGTDIHPGRRSKGRGAAGAVGSGRVLELPIYPPGPAERERWAAILADEPLLAPAQPRIRRVADGLASGLDDPFAWQHAARADRLRATGNGVVPLAAAAAYLALRAELELRADARNRARDAADGADLR